MIVTKQGKVKLDGRKEELLTDFCMIAGAIKNAFEEKGIKPERTKALLIESVNDAFLTTEELEDKVAKALKNLIDKLLNMED